MMFAPKSPAQDSTGVSYDRYAWVTGALLVAIAAICWIFYIVQGSAGMSLGMSSGVGITSIPALFSPLAIVAFLAAWGVMMAAMMLPSATPLIALYATIRRRAPAGQTNIPALVFAVVYLVAWLAAGVPVYAASVGVIAVVEVFPSIGHLIPYAVALTLVVAGVYQFTPLKSRCLSVCQSPVGFLMGHWRAGALGSLRMALEHALYCLGCCWGLMVVLVAAGAMSLPWALLIAAVVFAEKALPGGRWTARTAGVALMLLGVIIVAEPGFTAMLPM